MAGNSIHTNPEALRSIASSVQTYTNLQYDTISRYLKGMSGLVDDINLQSYRMALEAIDEWLKCMDRLRTDGEGFAAWLNEKAQTLDDLGMGR